jgi:hypothetical protein
MLRNAIIATLLATARSSPAQAASTVFERHRQGYPRRLFPRPRSRSCAPAWPPSHWPGCSRVSAKRNTQIDRLGEPACVALTAWM